MHRSQSPATSSYPPIMSSSSEENLASAGGGKTYPQVCAALVACLGAFLMGTGIGWSAPALNQLMMNDTAQPFVVTQTDANWIGSLTPAGALFGSESQQLNYDDNWHFSNYILFGSLKPQDEGFFNQIYDFFLKLNR